MSLAQVPVDDFLAITRYLTIKHGLDFEPSEDDGLYYTDCTNEQYDKLPDLEISLHKGKGSPESKTVKIPKSRYMIQSQFLSHNYVFGLQPQTNTPLGTKGNESYWILGDQFLQLYYTTFDWPQKRIGIVEANTWAGDVNISMALQYALYFLLCFIVLSGFCCFCCCCCKPCRKRLKKMRRKKLNQRLVAALNNVG